MLRKFRWVVRTFGRAISVVMALVGLYYLPANLWGIPEVYPEEYARLTNWIGGVTKLDIALAYTAVLTFWIVWRDVRPWLRRSWMPALEITERHRCVRFRKERNGYALALYLAVENKSNTFFDGLELKVTDIKPYNQNPIDLNASLQEDIDVSPIFGLSPRSSKDLEFIRVSKSASTPVVFFGPFRHGSSPIGLKCGLHKVSVVLFGRDISPIHETFAVALNDAGELMCLKWDESLDYDTMFGGQPLDHLVLYGGQ